MGRYSKLMTKTVNIIKIDIPPSMHPPPQIIYSFNAIPIKIPWRILEETDKLILKFIRKHQYPTRTANKLWKKKTERFKTCVIKTV